MGLVTLCSDDDQLGDTVIVPARQQLVDRAMEGLASKTGRAGVGPAVRVDDAVGKGWCYQNGKKVRKVVGNPLRDHGVGAERKMGTMLVECTHGHEQPWITLQDFRNFCGSHMMQGQ